MSSFLSPENVAGAIQLGYSAYRGLKRKRRLFTSPGGSNRSMRTDIVANAEHYHGKRKSVFKGRMSIPKQVRMMQDVVKYHFQSCSPYHAPGGAIKIANCYQRANFDGTDADNIKWILPMHLYDITSAPNIMMNSVPKSTFVASGVPVVNYNPMFRVVANTNTMEGGLSRGYKGVNQISIENGRVLGQGPDGARAATDGTADTYKRSGAGWQLRHTSVPLRDTDDNATLWGSATTRNFTAGSKNAIVHYGVAGGGLDPARPNYGLIPPVGLKPLHLSTRVKLCLSGLTNAPVTFDIALVKFVGFDAYHPDSSTTFDPATGLVTTRTFSGTNDYAVPVMDAQQEQNTALRVYENLAAPYSVGPDFEMDKSIYKYVRFLGKRSIKIDSQTNIDQDKTPDYHYVTMDFKWNEVRDYNWNKSGNTKSTGLPTYGGGEMVHGPGFDVNLASLDGAYPTVHPNQRIYLMIRARSPVFAHAGNQPLENVENLTGNLVVEDPDLYKNCPSYDIQITNTFVPDLG